MNLLKILNTDQSKNQRIYLLLLILALVIVLPTVGLFLDLLPETELYILILLSSRHFIHCHQQLKYSLYLLVLLLNYFVTVGIFYLFQASPNLIFALLVQIIYLLFVFFFSRKYMAWALFWHILAFVFYFYQPKYSYIIIITTASSMILLLMRMIVHPEYYLKNKFHVSTSITMNTQKKQG